MRSESETDYPVLSRFVYEERYMRDDGHPRKDVFIGPQSTRDISVDRHAEDVCIDWYAGAAVKSGMMPIASAEIPVGMIKRPLYVNPYSVPRMPRHADISGWQDAPGWGENKELAKELAKKIHCVRNPKCPSDEYVRPKFSFIINCHDEQECVLRQLRCLEKIDKSDFECVCCVLKEDSAVEAVVHGIELCDRRILKITVDPSDAQASCQNLLNDKSGARGDVIVFVGRGESLELAINSNGSSQVGVARSFLCENMGKIRFSECGDMSLR